MIVPYDLDCIDCSFRTTVVGTFPEAIEEADAHRTEQEAALIAHFVNIRHRE